MIIEPQKADPKSKSIVTSDMYHQTAWRLIQDKYNKAKDGRQVHEQQWLKNYNQWRGVYSSAELANLARLREKNPYASEAFIKITKTKCFAAFAQLEEVLFGTGKIPIGVEETPEPEGVAKEVYFAGDKDSKGKIVDPYGYKGDGKELPKGTRLRDLLNGLTSKYSSLAGSTAIVAGHNPDPINNPSAWPAKEAATRMDSVIQDQLIEARALSKLRKALWETVLYGTGVIKGPFTYQEFVPGWASEEGSTRPKYKPSLKLRPWLDAPSILNVFPDPKATCQEDLTYVIEIHKLDKNKLGQLQMQPGFDSDGINRLLSMNSIDDVLQDSLVNNMRDEGAIQAGEDRYTVFEFWGSVSGQEARDMGIEIDSSIKPFQMVNVCLWACQNICIRKMVNPFLPERIPYYFIPFEWHPQQLWGIGVPENMEDSQRIVNVHTRMAQDNMLLAGSGMLEVNRSLLVPGQDNSIYSGKVWERMGGGPGQAVTSLTFNNTAPQHLSMINSAMQWADVSSGIPSVTHGMTGITGLSNIGRTSGGLSMLMNAGALPIKTVVRNFDDFLFKPLAESLFNWNMQFNSDTPDIRGDFKIVAKGVALLMQREVMSQRLLSFMQMLSSPALAPFVNLPNVIEDFALSLDLDKDRYTNDPDVAKLYAQIIGEQANVNYGNAQPSSPQGQSPAGSPQGPNGAIDQAGVVGDGNGTIGARTPAVAGQAPGY